MTSKQLFEVGVRLVGMGMIAYGVVHAIAAFQVSVGEIEEDKAYLRDHLIVFLGLSGFGIYLVKGGRFFVRMAYPDVDRESQADESGTQQSGTNLSNVQAPNAGGHSP
jgi:hypothetical protein